MSGIRIKLDGRYWLIFTIAFIAATLSILHVLIGNAKTPDGSVYLWIPHYYLDYFVFVGGITQGMRGNWLLQNPYTAGDNSKTIMAWWQYIFYGKISSLLNISPLVFYSLVIFLLSFAIVWLMFFIIQKILKEKSFWQQILALILALSAGPFFNLNISGSGFLIVPHNFWNSHATFFDRFDPVPHHLLGTLICLLLILVLAKVLEKIKDYPVKKILWDGVKIAITVIFLLTFSPFQALNFILAAFLTGLFYLKSSKLKIFTFELVLLLLIIPAAILLKIHHAAVPMLALSSQADTGYQLHPSLKVMLLTTGPIILLVPLGIREYFKKLSPVSFILFLFTTVSFILFSTDLARILGSYNLRFLSPVSYLFWGISAVYGFEYISKRVSKAGRFLAYLSVIVILLTFIPTNFLIFYVRLVDVNIFSETAYLKKNIVGGFKFLNELQDSRAVLTSPSVFMGAILPIFADKKVYLGRHAFTPDYENKQRKTTSFYGGYMNEQEAREFLQKNRIGTVILTSMEGFNPDVLKRYKFLKEIYKNKDIIIFKL